MYEKVLRALMKSPVLTHRTLVRKDRCVFIERKRARKTFLWLLLRPLSKISPPQWNKFPLIW